jgi:uncharacterized protein (TIGR02391 family)
MVQQYPPLQAHIIESICKTIAETNDGLSGTEIGKILADCEISDTDPSLTKWKRLYNAFVNYQNQSKRSNRILKFIQVAMQPIRYIGREEMFHNRRIEVNKRLSFIGLEINEKGKYVAIKKSETIKEAEQRANRFKQQLESRDVHPNIFIYCISELLVENYFHSVFEATKSVADRIRILSGLNIDGNRLVDTTLLGINPSIRINMLSNETEQSEQGGLAYLIKGLFGIIRNPTAHIPKIKFEINEVEALEIMVIISYIHKRFDKAGYK